jgi:hypothetical protein
MHAGGGSAFWSSDGRLITALDEKNSGLVIARKENTVWTGDILILD